MKITNSSILDMKSLCKIKLILKLKTVKVDRYNIGFRSSYSEPHFSEWKLAMTNAQFLYMTIFLGSNFRYDPLS